MRMLIKKLLKKHKYPPEGMDDAVQTVMTQCELWTDNMMEFFIFLNASLIAAINIS